MLFKLSPKKLLKEALFAWLTLFIGVCLFVVLAMVVTLFGGTTDLAILIALVPTALFIVISHIYLSRHDYQLGLKVPEAKEDTLSEDSEVLNFELELENDRQLSTVLYIIVTYDEAIAVLILLKNFHILTFKELNQRLLSENMSTNNLPYLLDQLYKMAIVTKKPKRSFELTNVGKKVASAIDRATDLGMDKFEYARR